MLDIWQKMVSHAVGGKRVFAASVVTSFRLCVMVLLSRPQFDFAAKQFDTIDTSRCEREPS